AASTPTQSATPSPSTATPVPPAAAYPAGYAYPYVPYAAPGHTPLYTAATSPQVSSATATNGGTAPTSSTSSVVATNPYDYAAQWAAYYVQYGYPSPAAYPPRQ